MRTVKRLCLVPKSGNIRDPMVIRIGEIWHCYYTMHPQDKGADYCRTSTNLIDWSEPRTVRKVAKLAAVLIPPNAHS